MTILIPCCTFGRVFDTTPLDEVLTLPELIAALRRFEVKPETAQRIERDIARIRKARERLLEGQMVRGKFMGKLYKAMERARRSGEDPMAALDAAAEKMVADAEKSAKRDLRLWSPALYRPGATRRGKEGVTHVSCLVLDYDDGTAIREASTTWSAWFHLVYTTWSHTPDAPRFRLVMPLAFPVPAEDWSKVWRWAEEHAHFTIDPAMKSPAATYALPAVRSRDWPRVAFSRPGAILDPVDEGILERRTHLDLEPKRPPPGVPSLIRGEDPEHDYVDHVDPDAVYFVDEAWEEDHDWEASPELVAAAKASVLDGATAHRTRADARADAPAAAEARADAAAVADADAGARGAAGADVEAPAPAHMEADPDADAAADATARAADPSPSRDAGASADPRLALVDALERLARLRESGFLSEPEHDRAKALVLAPDPGDPPPRPLLSVDFDGVLHSYRSGWRGPTTIPDPPVDGAIEWLVEMDAEFDIAIVSVRNAYPGAPEAMRAWLREHGLPRGLLARIRFPLGAVDAALHVDDRAWRFEGRFPRLDELDLEPWWAD